MAKKVSMYDKADQKIQKVSKTIGAITAIILGITGACTWVNGQFQSVVSAQISEFRQETESYNLRHEQAVTRLELVMLIEHDPTNKAAIEKMARYYFITLEGDLYMTGRYSRWCEEYGGDASIILGAK